MLELFKAKIGYSCSAQAVSLISGTAGFLIYKNKNLPFYWEAFKNFLFSGGLVLSGCWILNLWLLLQRQPHYFYIIKQKTNIHIKDQIQFTKKTKS